MRNYLAEEVNGGLFSLLKWVLIAISIQNTWNFIRTPAFVPDQSIGYSILLMALYEGGMLFWLYHARHGSNNPARYLLAWLMFLVSLAAITMAMFYEMNGATLWLTHDFFATYAPMVTANTLLAELLVVLLYETINYRTYLHHTSIKQGGRFGELRGNKSSEYYVEEEKAQGEPARPLASPHRQQSEQPKEEVVNMENTGQIEIPQIEQPKPRTLKPMPRMKNPQRVSQNPQNHERGILSEGVSLLTQRLKSSITSGRTAGRVRGQTNQITEENM